MKLDDQIVQDSESNQGSYEELHIIPEDVDHQKLREEIRDMK